MSALIRDFKNGTVTILNDGGLPIRVANFYEPDYDWVLALWESQQVHLNKTGRQQNEATLQPKQ